MTQLERLEKKLSLMSLEELEVTYKEAVRLEMKVSVVRRIDHLIREYWKGLLLREGHSPMEAVNEANRMFSSFKEEWKCAIS